MWTGHIWLRNGNEPSTYLPTYITPWSRVSWSRNPPPFNGHRRFNTVFKSPPLVPIPSQIHPIHNFPPYFP